MLQHSTNSQNYIIGVLHKFLRIIPKLNIIFASLFSILASLTFANFDSTNNLNMCCTTYLESSKNFQNTLNIVPTKMSLVFEDQEIVSTRHVEMLLESITILTRTKTQGNKKLPTS